MRSLKQNPFPGSIGLDGFQNITNTCREGTYLRLQSGLLDLMVTLVHVETIGLPLKLVLHYRTKNDGSTTELGYRWRHNYMLNLNVTGSSTATFTDASGVSFDYTKSGSVWSQSAGATLSATLVEDTVNSEWRIEFLDGTKFTFKSSGGALCRIEKMKDKHGNELLFTYNGSGQLTTITEETGRTITLAYHSTTGRLTTITDPRGKSNTLTVDSNAHLTNITGPAGCSMTYTWDASHRIVQRTDPRSKNLYFEYKTGTDRIEKLRDHDHSTGSTYVAYVYDTIIESTGRVYSTDTPPTSPPSGVSTYQSKFDQTTVQLYDNGTKVSEWVVRFDETGNVWRLIDPLKRHTRCVWSDSAQLIYMSSGYPPLEAPDPSARAYREDNPQNVMLSNAYDEDGNLISTLDPNGLMTAMTYNDSQQITSISPGIAHYGIQGNWQEHFGKDGWLLCGFDGTSTVTDRSSLPSYVSSVSEDAGDPLTKANNRSASALKASDPCLPVAPGTREKIAGFWQPNGDSSDKSFTFKVNLTGTRSFLLSLYSHEGDKIGSPSSGVEIILKRHNISGRDVTYTITDLDGTRTFTVLNNAVGIWTTFGVRGNSNTPVTVKVEGTLAQPRISTLAFDTDIDYDPTSDPTNRPTFKPQRYLTMAYSGGNLTEIKDGLGNTTAMEYYTDARKGLLKKITDAHSKVTEFDYADTHRNLTKIKDALLAETLFGYDNNGNLTSVQNPLTHSTAMAYDDENRLVSITDALSHQTEFDYDSSGNLEQVIDANGNRTTMTYTSMNRLASLIEDDDYSGHTGLKLTTQFTWDLWGNLTSVTDPMGNETTFEYDAAHQLVKVHLPDPNDEQQVKMVYNALGRLTALTTPNGTPNGSSYQAGMIDPTGLANLLSNPGAEETLKVGNGTYISAWYPSAATYLLDNDYRTNDPHSGSNSFLVGYWGVHFQPLQIPSGMPLRAKAWVRRNSGTNPMDAKMVLDFVGQDGTSDPATFNDYLSATVVASQSVETNSWQEMGPVVLTPPGTMQSRVVNFRIGKGDATGDELYFDDLELQMLGTGYLHDPSGRLAQVDLPNGTRWMRTYDRLGRLVEMTDAMGRSVRIEYDVLDRVRKLTDSLNGVYQFQYNALGQITKFIEPGGAMTSYTFDDVGRLSVITYPDNSTEEYTWNAAGSLSEYQDNVGRTFGLFYDNAERLTEIRYLSLSPTKNVLLALDNVGNVTSITERNGDETELTRDGAHRVLTETFTPGSGSSSPAWSHGFNYDKNGNRTLLLLDNLTPGRYGTSVYGTGTYGDNLWVVPTDGFDQSNRLTKFRNGRGLLTQMTYGREGRRTSIAYPNEVQASASYDFMGHLLSLNYSKASASVLQQQYAYDLTSNRTAYVANGDTFEYTLDENQRLVRECLNCFSYRTTRELQAGAISSLDTATATNKVQLLGWDDPFDSSTLNLDRWRVVFPARVLPNSSLTSGLAPESRGIEIAQGSGGLHFAFVRGMTTLITRDDALSPLLARYPLPSRFPQTFQDVAGVEHRMLLTGDFEVEVEFDSLQMLSNSSYFGLRVRDRQLENDPVAVGNTYADLSIARISGALKWRSRRKGPLITFEDINTPVTGVPTKIWMKRTGTWIETRYTDGSGTQSYGTTANLETTASTLYLALFVNQKDGSYNCIRFKNFKRLDSQEYAASGTWTSPVYDSGRDSTDYDKIYWNETLPTNTDVKFQVYASNTLSNMDNPTYTGPDATSGSYYSTPTGESFHSGVVGRYFRLKAFLSSDSGQTVTPDFSALRVTYAGGSGANAWSETINTFDSRGNMTRREKTYWNGSATVTDTDVRDDAGWSAGDRINNLNQIKRQDITPAGGATTTWRYTFDSNGRLTQKTDGGSQVFTYSWDPDEPRLTRVQGPGGIDVSYTYDSAGRMLTRVSGGVTTTFEWDGWTLVKETTGPVVTRYVAPQGQLHSFERGGQVYQVHSDGHNGSVRAITDASGAVVAHYEFDAWGAQLGSSSPFSGGFAFGYVGSLGVRTDATTGLIWMRHRWYSVGLARFLSRDQLDSRANLYQYASSSPVQRIDPSGLQDQEDLIGWIVEMMPGERVKKIISQKLDLEGLAHALADGEDVVCKSSSARRDVTKRANEILAERAGVEYEPRPPLLEDNHTHTGHRQGDPTVRGQRIHPDQSGHGFTRDPINTRRFMGNRPRFRGRGNMLMTAAGIGLLLTSGAEAAAANEPVFSSAYPGTRFFSPIVGRDFGQILGTPYDLLDPYSQLQDFIETGETIWFNLFPPSTCPCP